MYRMCVCMLNLDQDCACGIYMSYVNNLCKQLPLAQDNQGLCYHGYQTVGSFKVQGSKCMLACVYECMCACVLTNCIFAERLTHAFFLSVIDNLLSQAIHSLKNQSMNVLRLGLSPEAPSTVELFRALPQSRLKEFQLTIADRQMV